MSMFTSINEMRKHYKELVVSRIQMETSVFPLDGNKVLLFILLLFSVTFFGKYI